MRGSISLLLACTSAVACSETSEEPQKYHYWIPDDSTSTVVSADASSDERDRALLAFVFEYLLDNALLVGPDNRHIAVRPTAKPVSPDSGEWWYRSSPRIRSSSFGQLVRDLDTSGETRSELPFAAFAEDHIEIVAFPDHCWGGLPPMLIDWSDEADPQVAVEDPCDAGLFIETSLPVYLADDAHAFITLEFGPTAHGASAQFVLERSGDTWSVLWWRVWYYA